MTFDLQKHLKTVPIFFNLFKSCHDGTLLYPTGNPVVTKHFENFIGTYKKFLDLRGKLTIAVQMDFVKIHGQTVPANIARLPAVSWFIVHCLDRKIFDITFKKGLRLKEMKQFVGVMQKNVEAFKDFQMVQTMLREEHIDNIQVNTAMEAMGNAAAGYLNQAIHFHAAKGPLPEGATSIPIILNERENETELTVDGEMPTPDLFLSNEDKDKLYQTISNFIKSGNLKRVGETLGLIRQDLQAPTREERELAYSSYNIVILAMIDQNQEKSLSAVVKTLLADLQSCQEPDLYAIHLRTLTKLADYFQAVGHMPALIYSLDIMANQNLRQSGENQKRLELELQTALALPQLTKIILCEEPEAQPIVRSLFEKHGAGIVQPMLKALFSSEDRNIRKKVLEYLQRLGTLIYPALLLELETALNRNDPWYAKRNLLTLLAVKPPIDLATHLEALFEEDNQKVKDLVVRCAFLIADKQAYQFSKQLLKQARGGQLKKLFGYLAVSKDPAYVRDLIDIFENAQSERVKLEVIRLLAKIGGVEATDFLGTLLGQTTLFTSKFKKEYRQAAAEGLAEIGKPQALSILIRHQKDSDKIVRATAKKSLIAREKTR